MQQPYDRLDQISEQDRKGENDHDRARYLKDGQQHAKEQGSQ
jgi:hypothetical protein